MDTLHFLWAVNLIAALVGFLIFWDAVNELNDSRKWDHHVYIGMALACVPPRWSWVPVLWILGQWILWDDAYQHNRQIGEPDYLSPWHRWYEKVYRAVIR